MNVTDIGLEPAVQEAGARLAPNTQASLADACRLSIAISLKRIADALETRPVRHIHMPPGSSGKIVGDIATFDSPRTTMRPWTKHNGNDLPPAGYRTDGGSVRVQFDDGRIETHAFNSTDVDWRHVIAYQPQE